jgi:hypothetical protein
MGIVTDYLIELVHKNLNNYGIVVWYDSKNQYRAVAERLMKDVPVLFYDGSYFEIRYSLEPYLDAREREKVLVYIPEKHETVASPLIEAEYYGTFIKPGAQTGMNTRLEIIARNALADIFDHDTITGYEKKINEGSLTLEDLDELAKKGKEIPTTGAISLIFITSDPVDITLQFLSNAAHDQKIEEKNAFNEIEVLIGSHFGFKESTSGINEYRGLLIRYVLISEFIGSLPEGVDMSTLNSVPKAQKNAHRDACKKLVNTWRNRSDLKDNYISSAEKVEKDYNLASISIAPESVVLIETFSWCEKALINHAIDLVINEQFSKALEIAKSRMQAFWIRVNYKNSRMLWKLISTSALLSNLSEDIRNEIGKSGADAKTMVKRYTDYSSPTAWYHLDQLYRHLEVNYSDYYRSAIDDEADLDHMITMVTKTYCETIELIAETFSEALIKDNFKLDGLMTQRKIFSKMVKPKLSQGKTAYFLVDALRYEMGVDLCESLKAKDKKIDFALATPPTITTVGMAALLPSAEENFSIVNTKTKKVPLASRINDTVLKTREDRIKYLEENAHVKVTVLKLGEMPKNPKVLKEKIDSADLILITTREIDLHNMEDNKELVRKIMIGVLEQIVTAVRRLRDNGIQNFIITADHGHLFGEDIGTDMKIDPPGGETIYLGKRCWIGRGGITSESCFRVKPSAFGIDGDFEFVFPKSIACFMASGGGLSFLHGGLSLQEFVIPVIRLLAETPKTTESEKGLGFRLKYGKEKVTNPFFTVEARFSWKEILIGPHEYRVRLELRADGKRGKVVSASPDYKFDNITGEITLKKEETYHITLMLPEEIKKGKVSIYILDAETSQELDKIENLEISIAI